MTNILRNNVLYIRLTNYSAYNVVTNKKHFECFFDEIACEELIRNKRI